jgi:hypothetical protein
MLGLSMPTLLSEQQLLEAEETVLKLQNLGT